MMVKIGVIFKFYMPLQQYKLIYLPKAFRWVNYLIALKWHVGYKNENETYFHHHFYLKYANLTVK